MRDEITAKHIDYETPMSIFKVLDNEFHFTLDVAASAKNAKCERHFIHNNSFRLQRVQPTVCFTCRRM